MKKLILITGVGITGKSSFRKMMKKLFPWMIDIDGDYDKLPKRFDDDKSYIIEDVHASQQNKGSCLPLDNYDLVFYLLPGFLSHTTFWLNRVWKWFQNGYGSWDKETQNWKGTERRYDPTNIPLFLSLMIRDLRNRRKWTTKDLKVLCSFRGQVTIVHSQLTKQGIKFSFMYRGIKFFFTYEFKPFD